MFNIGDNVKLVNVKGGTSCSQYKGKIGKISAIQNSGNNQFVRVSFGPRFDYIDVANWRLAKA